MILYPINSSYININYKNNRYSLDSLITSISDILLDADLVISKIVISGYTSIDGSYAFNEILSKKRAIALRNYLINNTKINNSIFEVKSLGENWMELRKIVELSNIECKKQVLNIIDNVPIFEGREKQLMDLNKGDTYRYMKKHFFPALRQATYVKILYDNKK